MTVHHSSENFLNAQPALAPVGWDRHLAHWISQVGSPPVTASVSVLLVGYFLASPTAWLWAIGYDFLAVFFPALYVVWLCYRGIVSDLHLRVRAQRTRPSLVTLAAALGVWALLYFGSGPRLLLILAGANIIQTVLFFGITLYWKISAHAAAAAGLAILAWLLIGPAAMPALMSVPLIAWSRVRLGDHTPAQTVAGTILGGLVLTLAFLLDGG